MRVVTVLNYADGVRQRQPRAGAQRQPWDHFKKELTLKGFGLEEPFQSLSEKYLRTDRQKISCAYLPCNEFFDDDE